jgi:hypothetical protein
MLATSTHFQPRPDPVFASWPLSGQIPLMKTPPHDQKVTGKNLAALKKQSAGV